ncbi:MAG: class I SAM-dependent rRNA methyltransferase, partial [Blastocatellia bacterium]|nr:class I SAM-dependent rRNA methyltransferase [Blastocatellia bacterium]
MKIEAKSISEVQITRKGQQRLASGHLWIYRSDLEESSERSKKGKGSSKQQLEPGSIVEVVGYNGKTLGRALYSSKSQIALRMLTSRDEIIDRGFWKRRLEMALALRKQVVIDAEAYRVVHGEADLLPSLIVDKYKDYLVIQMLSQGMDSLREVWVELLSEIFQPKAIVERNDVKVRKLEGLSEQVAVLAGTAPDEITVNQNGLLFTVDLLRGQKTGLFLDQRENHATAMRYAKGRALDCFTFVGGFALHMAKSAETVLGLDVSEVAIAQAERNAKLNRLNVTFEAVNVFDRLRNFYDSEEKFDTVVLDPPAFAKNREAVEGATRGYKEINMRAMKLIKPGGILITCTCSFHVSEELFLGILQSAAADAGRQV